VIVGLPNVAPVPSVPYQKPEVGVAPDGAIPYAVVTDDGAKKFTELAVRPTAGVDGADPWLKLTPPAAVPVAAKPLAWTVSGPHADGEQVALIDTVVWATAYVGINRRIDTTIFLILSLPMGLSWKDLKARATPLT
jgi:hypothetical protein